MSVLRMLTLPLTTGWQWFITFPKYFSIPALLVALVLATYFLWFGLETPVAYAYSGHNCVARWTWLPDSQQTESTSPFAISYHEPITLFGFTVASRQACMELTRAIEPGTYKISASPFHNWLAAVRYNIGLAELPKISLTALNKPIPLTKPMVLSLSTHDETFSYVLGANERESDCQTKGKALHCELGDLALEQGKSYEFALERYFADKPIETVVEKKAEILRATTVTGGSIQPNEVVLSKPTELTVQFDKPIASVVAELSRVSGDNPEKVTAEQLNGDQEVKLTFADLPRQAEFEVRVDKLVAKDESSLVEPYVFRFKTSGGPRVSGVSIPKAGVALGARAVIRFDQELSPEQNLASLVSVEGGGASVVRSGNTAVVTLNGVGKCTDFSIRVANDVQSIYGVGGNSAWSFDSRTVCHTVEVYGYSTKGRPLLAYYFGTGSTAILYTGAIHGNEISSSYLMDNWINELELNARSLPADRRIVVVPEINPDGVAAGSRNNASNVDLNRNFDVSDWQKDITDTYGKPIPGGGGNAPMSELETKAIAALITKLKPRLTINYHSIGGLVIANQTGGSAGLARTYSRLSGYGNATGQSSSTFDYAISGTLDDWMAEKLGLPTLLVELGSHTYSQFPSNKTAMWEMARY